MIANTETDKGVRTVLNLTRVIARSELPFRVRQDGRFANYDYPGIDTSTIREEVWGGFRDPSQKALMDVAGSIFGLYNGGNYVKLDNEGRLSSLRIGVMGGDFVYQRDKEGNDIIYANVKGYSPYPRLSIVFEDLGDEQFLISGVWLGPYHKNLLKSKAIPSQFLANLISYVPRNISLIDLACMAANSWYRDPYQDLKKVFRQDLNALMDNYRIGVNFGDSVGTIIIPNQAGFDGKFVATLHDLSILTGIQTEFLVLPCGSLCPWPLKTNITTLFVDGENILETRQYRIGEGVHNVRVKMKGIGAYGSMYMERAYTIDLYSGFLTDQFIRNMAIETLQEGDYDRDKLFQLMGG